MTIPRLYYVRGGASSAPVLDLKKRPNDAMWKRRLVDIKRSGLAWAYRGIYVGVVRTGTYQHWDRHDSTSERHRWMWTLWVKRSTQALRQVYHPDDELSVEATYTRTTSAIDATVQRWLTKYLQEFPDMASVDLIPMAIHVIEDPVARQSATDAYLESII